jgi:uncharacterized protein
MKIFMTGGTGFVGRVLAKAFLIHGNEVTVLTRRLRIDPPAERGLTFVQGDPTEKGAWQECVPNHDVIVNLAGTTIFGRWTKERKHSIRTSRLLTTQNLVEALSRGKNRVSRLFSTSAVGYYGFRGDEVLDEGSPPGEGFLADLSQEWESAARSAEPLGVAVTLLRFGVVLGREGGALRQMASIFRRYLGAPLGSGKQWFSWIHEEDLAAIYLHLLQSPPIRGPVNCTSPHPVRNEEMTRGLGAALERPVFLPNLPSFLMKIFLGEFSSALLEGQRVVPGRLIESGFRFQFPEIRKALTDLLCPPSK